MDIETRAHLARLFAQRGYKVGAEIGVAEGEYAQVLCGTIPGLKYYGIDSWPREGKLRNYIQARYELAKKRLEPYNATLIVKTSMEAVKDFENSSLDFVYIDASHQFDPVVYDIIEWTKKVRKGGVVAGHDYRLTGDCGVVPAVDGYVRSHMYHLNLTTDENETITWWFDKRWRS